MVKVSPSDGLERPTLSTWMPRGTTFWMPATSPSGWASTSPPPPTPRRLTRAAPPTGSWAVHASGLERAAAMRSPTGTVGRAGVGASPQPTSKSMLTSKKNREMVALPLISQRPGPLRRPSRRTEARLMPS